MGATIRITPTAWMKMQTLVMGYDKEVGWFGTCEKIAPLEYRIKDILIFPQYTSGCFIDDERDDPLEFRKWLDTLDDDTYNSRRLWGHSHVNMSTFPSGTDTDMFQRFRHTSCAAPDNKFAICLILNKRMEMFWKVFDGETNKEYDKKDINVMIEVDDCGTTNLEYYEQSKSLVRDIRPTTAFIYGGYTYSSYRNTPSYSDIHKEIEGYNYGNHNATMAKNNQPKVTTPTSPVKPALPEKPANPVVPTKPIVVKEDSTEPVTPVNLDDDLDEYKDVCADVYGDIYLGNDIEDFCFEYDVIVESDAIVVMPMDFDCKIDYKNDLIFEDQISGIIYRLTITDEELVENHPVSNDSVLMTLIDELGDEEPDNRLFSIYEETDEDHEVALTPLDEEDVIDLMCRTVVHITPTLSDIELRVKSK